MIGRRITLKRGNRDDAEKPFWISFADLMTALMVLFLVSLSVALVHAQAETDRAKKETANARQAQKDAIQAQEELERAKAELERREKERDTRRDQRTAEVKAFLDEVDKIVRRHAGVALDRVLHVVNFGTRAQFSVGSHELTLEQANTLRSFLPELLAGVRNETQLGRNWLKRIVAEGFTDDTGSYLYNLNLSLQRSQRVLCVLLAREWQVQPNPLPRGPLPNTGQARELPPELAPISDDDDRMIRALFLVGGYSSNSQRTSRVQSRRIELRIEFFQLEEPRSDPQAAHGVVGKCALGERQ